MHKKCLDKRQTSSMLMQPTDKYDVMELITPHTRQPQNSRILRFHYDSN